MSGDGRDTPTGSSFPRQVLRALRRGWSVEIWSWKELCTSIYRRMIDAGEGAGGRLIVRYLDNHYGKVTFVKGGTYVVRGNEVVVPARHAQALGGTTPVA